MAQRSSPRRTIHPTSPRTAHPLGLASVARPRSREGRAHPSRAPAARISSVWRCTPVNTCQDATLSPADRPCTQAVFALPRDGRQLPRRATTVTRVGGSPESLSVSRRRRRRRRVVVVVVSVPSGSRHFSSAKLCVASCPSPSALPLLAPRLDSPVEGVCRHALGRR